MSSRLLNVRPGRKFVGSPDTPLAAGLAIGMPFFMGQPGKAVRLGKGYHLRMKNRVFAGAVQHCQVGVVDDTDSSRIPQPAQRLMEEALHAPTVEASVKLNIPHFAVAQIQAAALYQHGFSPKFDAVWGGVVLHFGPPHSLHMRIAMLVVSAY